MRRTRKSKHRKRLLKRRIWLTGSALLLLGVLLIYLQGTILHQNQKNEYSNLLLSQSHMATDFRPITKVPNLGKEDIETVEKNQGQITERLDTGKTQEPTKQPEEQRGSNQENAEVEEGIETEVEVINKVAYLTFDDGPRDCTEEILALLNQYNAKATFFMLEPNIRKHAEIVKQIVEHGHQVGVHSVTHDKEIFYASKESVVNEMQKSMQTLSDLTGIETALIRVPYGSVPYMSQEYRNAVEENQMIMWDWNIDSQDWKRNDGSYIEYTIDQIEKFSLEEPLVILLHDLESTVAYLEELLQFLSEAGYTMERIETTITPIQFQL